MPVPIRRPSRLKSFFSSIVPSRVKNWWIRRSQRKNLEWAQRNREPGIRHDEVRKAVQTSLHEAVSAEEQRRQREALEKQLRKHVLPKEEGNSKEERTAGEERNTEGERNTGEE